MHPAHVRYTPGQRDDDVAIAAINQAGYRPPRVSREGELRQTLAERVAQVDTVGAATRAAADIAVERQQQHRLGRRFGDSRRDDAEHARVPVGCAEHDRGTGFACDQLLNFILQLPFDLEARFVVAFEHLGGLLCFDEARSTQQRDGVVGMADATRGVDQRRNAERDVLDTGAAMQQAGGVHQRPDAWVPAYR